LGAHDVPGAKVVYRLIAAVVCEPPLVLQMSCHANETSTDAPAGMLGHVDEYPL
jgi:hypothetical protein